MIKVQVKLKSAGPYGQSKGYMEEKLNKESAADYEKGRGGNDASVMTKGRYSFRPALFEPVAQSCGRGTIVSVVALDDSAIIVTDRRRVR